MYIVQMAAPTVCNSRSNKKLCNLIAGRRNRQEPVAVAIQQQLQPQQRPLMPASSLSAFVAVCTILLVIVAATSMDVAASVAEAARSGAPRLSPRRLDRNRDLTIHRLRLAADLLDQVRLCS